MKQKKRKRWEAYYTKLLHEFDQEINLKKAITLKRKIIGLAHKLQWLSPWDYNDYII